MFPSKRADPQFAAGLAEKSGLPIEATTDLSGRSRTQCEESLQMAPPNRQPKSSCSEMARCQRTEEVRQRPRSPRGTQLSPGALRSAAALLCAIVVLGPIGPKASARRGSLDNTFYRPGGYPKFGNKADQTQRAFNNQTQKNGNIVNQFQYSPRWLNPDHTPQVAPEWFTRGCVLNDLCTTRAGNRGGG